MSSSHTLGTGEAPPKGAALKWTVSTREIQASDALSQPHSIKAQGGHLECLTHLRGVPGGRRRWSWGQRERGQC